MVLGKMNQKLKALNSLRTQQAAKLQTTEQERDELKSLVVHSAVMTKRPTPILDGDDTGSTSLETMSVADLSKIWKTMERQEEDETQCVRMRSYGIVVMTVCTVIEPGAA